MANEPVYVTFEFRGNLEEEVNKVTLGIQGLRDESAKTYQRLIADSSTAFNSMSEGNRKLAVSVQENINELRNLAVVQKALDDEMQAGTITTQNYTQSKAALAAQESALHTAISAGMQTLNARQRVESEAIGSISSLTKKLRELTETYYNLSKADREGAVGQGMLTQIQSLDKEIGTAHTRLSQYSRTAGSGFNGLSMSVQQVARELPSLTMGANMFFLAISNNLPILADNLKAARIENELLKKSNQATTPVWKQVLSSIISWQTALVVGITLLSVYGKEVIAWTKNLFTGGTALKNLSEIQSDVNKKFISSSETVGKQITDLKSLQSRWVALGSDINKQKKFINDNQSAFDAMGVSVHNVHDAENLLITNTAAFIQVLKMRAQATAAQTLASEQYAKQIEAEAKAAEKRKEADEQRKSTKTPAITYVQDTRYGNMKSAKQINEDLAKGIEGQAKALDKEAEAARKTADAYFDLKVAKEKEADATLDKAGIKEKEIKTPKPKTGKTKEQLAQEAANILKAETAMRLLEIANKQQDVSTAEKESELIIRQNKIDLMDESSAKELEQLRLNHEKRLLEIRKAGAEQVKAQQDIELKEFEVKNPNWKKKGDVFQPATQSVNQLPEQQKKYLEDMQKQADALLNKSTSDYYKKELEAYMTYAEKRLTLQKQYAKLREDAEVSGNTARIENINREEKESLEKIDTLFGEREASFQGWANGMVNLSLVQLGQLLEQAQAKLAYARMQAGKGGKLGENNDTAKYRAQIIELQAKIKELTVNTQKDTGTSFKDWKKVYGVLGDVNDELNEIGDNVGGATGEIIRMASEITTSTLSMISGITTLANWSVEATRLAAEGASKAIIAVERASIILAVISAAIQIVSKIVNAFDGLKDAERDHEEHMKLLISLQEEYNKKLVETQLLQDDVWGTDGIGNMIDAINALDMAMDNYNNKLSESQKAWKDPNGNFWKKLYQYGTIMGWVGMKPGQLIGTAEGGPGTTDLRSNLRYITKKSSNGFLGIGGNHTKTMNLEEWVKNNIKNPDGSPADLFFEDGRLNLEIATSLVENNSDRLAGETKESLEALIEFENSIRAAEEAMRDYISDTFGVLGDGLTDAIVDAFQNGTDAAQTFRDNITEVLEDVGRQMVRNLFVQQAVEAYEDELEKVYKNYAANRDDSTTADEEAFNRELANATENFFGGALSAIDQGNKFLEMYDAEMKKHGFDTYKPTDNDEGRQAVAKGIPSMSQDSANELNGNFNTMLIFLDVTSKTVTNINLLLVEGLTVLNRIAANTDRLENIEGYMKSMSNNMQQMINKGLIMRKS